MMTPEEEELVAYAEKHGAGLVEFVDGEGLSLVAVIRRLSDRVRELEGEETCECRETPQDVQELFDRLHALVDSGPVDLVPMQDAVRKALGLPPRFRAAIAKAEGK